MSPRDFLQVWHQRLPGIRRAYLPIIGNYNSIAKLFSYCRLLYFYVAQIVLGGLYDRLIEQIRVVE